MADLNYRGLSELQKFLDLVPVKIERNILRGAFRYAMTKEVKPLAQANARRASGLYAEGLKVGTRARGGTVTANLKATGRHAFLGLWIEFGTKAHNIAAKTAKWLSFGGIFAKQIRHPGARPFPHMRPALDTGAPGAVVAAAEYMKTRLSTKHGLDTLHITVEGDE